MIILCPGCKKEIETKTDKERLCKACYARMKTLFCKLASIQYKGGQCEICGWAGHPAGFDFHHINPDEKEYEINRIGIKGWDKIKKELDKCQLLCSICHRKQHNKNWDEILFITYLDATTKVDIYTDWLDDNTKEMLESAIKNKVPFQSYITGSYTCQYCNESFDRTHPIYLAPKYCSKECMDKAQGVVENKPTKEELEVMKKTMSWEEIAKQYRVNRKAVYKWRKKYGMLEK